MYKHGKLFGIGIAIGVRQLHIRLTQNILYFVIDPDCDSDSDSDTDSDHGTSNVEDRTSLFRVNV